MFSRGFPVNHPEKNKQKKQTKKKNGLSPKTKARAPSFSLGPRARLPAGWPAASTGSGDESQRGRGGGVQQQFGVGLGFGLGWFPLPQI